VVLLAPLLRPVCVPKRLLKVEGIAGSRFLCAC
jgi:hypothetical protein